MCVNAWFRFAGVKKAVGTYGPKGGVPAAADADSDDDLDLFGSDDEEDKAELAKLKEDRIAAYNAKKTKSMYRQRFGCIVQFLLYA